MQQDHQNNPSYNVRVSTFSISLLNLEIKYLSPYYYLTCVLQDNVCSKLPSLPDQAIFQRFDQFFIFRSTNDNGHIQHGSENGST
jgi:hypothetical protein